MAKENLMWQQRIQYDNIEDKIRQQKIKYDDIK